MQSKRSAMKLSYLPPGLEKPDEAQPLMLIEMASKSVLFIVSP